MPVTGVDALFLCQAAEDTWLVPERLSKSALEAALAEHYTVEAMPEYRATVTYMDSFDWRLYQAGMLLHMHRRAWSLYEKGGQLTLLKGGPLCKKSCLIDAFPEGAMRAALEPVLGIRALLPLAKVELCGQQLHLRNSDGKIVLRLVLEEQRLPDGEQLFRMARVFPLRGYDEELTSVRSLLQQEGIVEPVSPLAGFEAGCLAAGRTPLDYSSKFVLDLDPQTSAHEAMRQVYLQLLEVLRRNLPGTIDDLDSEFLHDLRVAVRRTRSAMSQTKGVFAAGAIKPFRDGFAEIGRATGPARDLDVYLLTEAACLARLQPQLRPALEAYFPGISRQRRRARRSLARFLRSSKLERFLADWEGFLNAADQAKGPLADTPIATLASRIIRKHSKKVLAGGHNLSAATPDAEVHQLRIECKKLRYSMEFFSSLYDQEAFSQVLKQLKAVQSILGSFNDLSVQQELLLETISVMQARKDADAEQIAALGALMQSLFEEQQPLRDHFAEVFAAMSSETQVELIAGLFGKNAPS